MERPVKMLQLPEGTRPRYRGRTHAQASYQTASQY